MNEDEKKKPSNSELLKKYRKYNRTGEDIDMLNERSHEPQSGSAGSYAYKDHIDAA